MKIKASEISNRKKIRRIAFALLSLFPAFCAEGRYR